MEPLPFLSRKLDGNPAVFSGLFEQKVWKENGPFCFRVKLSLFYLSPSPTHKKQNGQMEAKQTFPFEGKKNPFNTPPPPNIWVRAYSHQAKWERKRKRSKNKRKRSKNKGQTSKKIFVFRLSLGLNTALNVQIGHIIFFYAYTKALHHIGLFCERLINTTLIGFEFERTWCMCSWVPDVLISWRNFVPHVTFTRPNLRTHLVASLIFTVFFSSSCFLGTIFPVIVKVKQQIPKFKYILSCKGFAWKFFSTLIDSTCNRKHKSFSLGIVFHPPTWLLLTKLVPLHIIISKTKNITSV